MIEFHGTGHDYGGINPIRDMSLRLEPGSFHFLTGPSGAGKTTILRLVTRELLPTEGRMTVLGQDVATLDRDGAAALRRRIGIVHQDLRFVDHLTATQNAALPLTVAGRAPDRGQIEELLTWVGLGQRAEAHPPTLSGGERQRLALARAVVTSPELVIADEPTGNVDWAMSQRLLELLVELNRLGTGILVATHDLSLIRAARQLVPARVLRLSGGALALAGADL